MAKILLYVELKGEEITENKALGVFETEEEFRVLVDAEIILCQLFDAYDAADKLKAWTDPTEPLKVVYHEGSVGTWTIMDL